MAVDVTDTIGTRAATLVEEFDILDDWVDKYEYLIELGKSAPPLDERFKTDDYKIRGCRSQVWVRPEYRNGLIYFAADSDALITKGLVAILVRVLDGQPPEAIAQAGFGFVEEIGLHEHLSATRKNGLSSMIKKLQSYAAQQRNL